MGYAYRKERIITSENKQSLEKHEENLDSITTGQVMLSQ